VLPHEFAPFRSVHAQPYDGAKHHRPFGEKDFYAERTSVLVTGRSESSQLNGCGVAFYGI
jgi:hypothetical protein